MYVRSKLSKEQTFSWLAAHENSFQYFSFVTALFINFLVVVSYVAPSLPVSEESGSSLVSQEDFNYVHPYIYYIIMLAGLVQVVCSTLTLFIYRRFHEPIILRRAWKERKPDVEYEDLERNLAFHILSFYFLLKDPVLLHNTLRVIFAVCGVSLSSWTSAFFFSYHLFDVVARSKMLQSVLKAVTQNGGVCTWLDISLSPIRVSTLHLRCITSCLPNILFMFD